MFRSGGPIKEGIMDGMQNRPQQLVQPAADGGRPGYAGPLAFLGLNALRTGAMRMAPRAVQGIKNFFTTSKPAPFSPVTIGQSQGGKLLNLTPKVVRGGKGPNVKDVAQVSELKPYFANDPTIALVRGTYNALTNPQAKGLFSKGARFVLSPTGVITGGYFAAGKFFDKDGNQIDDKVAKESGLTAGDKIDEKVIKGESDTGGKKLTRDEEIEANRNRYYKLMGIDKMKKGAAYDSLIDASRIIQEEGGDLKGAIKSGTLQSQIINAISKNLDKSTDLKKQIDAAILKGEITKDINKDKDALTKELTKKRIQVADKQLAGATLAETKTAYQKAGESLSGQNLYAEATRAGTEVAGILDTKTANKFLTDNPTLTEADFIKKVQEDRIKNNKDPLPEGNYVVGGRIVHISEGGLVDEFIF
jgi:hypothetical protein